MKDEAKKKNQPIQELKDLRKQIADKQACATEQKLHETEYKTIIQASMDGFWLSGLQGNFLDVNEAYCKLIGYNRDELLAMKIRDIEAAESPEETVRHIKEIKERGFDRFETRHRCKNGNIVDIEVSSNYLNIGDGRFCVFLRDITERKKIEKDLLQAQLTLEDRVKERTNELSKANEALLVEIAERKKAKGALLESEERYRILLEKSFNGILVHENFRILDLNQKMTGLTGYSRSELLGTMAIDLFTHGSKEVIRAYISSGSQGSYEIELRRKDGSVCQVESFGAPCTFQGRTARIVAIRDITEKKKTEEEIRRRIKELEDFYDMAVGRELRMIELKEEIKTLKEELEQYKN